MRTATVSPLCVFLLLICSPRPTAGQSNFSSPLPSAQNPPASPKLFELPRATQSAAVPAQTDSTNQLTNPTAWKNLLAQHNSLSEYHLWSLNNGVLPQLEAGHCAHILIFRAPDTDPEMIVGAPPGFGGNITTFKGLQACCRDLRGFHGLPSIAPKHPLVQPPFVLPKKNGQLAPKFENWQNRLRP